MAGAVTGPAIVKADLMQGSWNLQTGPVIVPVMTVSRSLRPLLRGLVSCACALLVALAPAALPGHCHAAADSRAGGAAAGVAGHEHGPQAPEHAGSGCHCVGACCMPHAVRPADMADSGWLARMPVAHASDAPPAHAPAPAPSRRLPFAIPPPIHLG